MFGETIMHKLANRKDVTEQLFLKFMELGADINQRDLMKDTPIGLLFYNEREDIIKAILEKYPEKVDPSLFMESILAILNEKEDKKHLKMLQDFMQENNLYENPTKRFSEQIIKIGKRAVEDGEGDLVREILKIKSRSRNKLFKSVFSATFEMGDIALVEKLFNNNKNQLQIAIDNSDCLLHHACKNGDYFLTLFALKHFSSNAAYFLPKEELKDKDETLLYPPISWAVLSGEKKVIVEIVDAIDAQGIQKITLLSNNTKERQYDPLALSLNNGDYDVAKFLLDNGYFTNQYVFKNLREEREGDSDKLNILSDINMKGTFENVISCKRKL